jgi:cytochrome P450
VSGASATQSFAGLPPGPSWPALVQLGWYLSRPIELFEHCAARFGDLFTLNLGPNGKWVFLCSPEHVKSMYLAGSGQFNAGEAKASIFGPVVGGTSSLVLDGEAHLRRRRLLLPAFQGDRMLGYTEMIRDLTLRAIDAWRPGEVRSIHVPMQQIALHAMLQAMFGSEVLERPVAASMRRFADEAVGSPLLLLKFLQRDLGRYSPWGRILRTIRAADKDLFAEVSCRRSSEPSGSEDLLSLLLAARDEGGRPLSDQELRDELVTMVVAGHEITGISLCWAIGAIISNREVNERITAELGDILKGGPLQREHIPQLRFLDAALKESLRLHSTVVNGSARRLVRPWELGAYCLPSGIMASVCIHLLHRRVENYPEPLQFRPERFLGRQPGPYEWAPFGGGIRRCLGMSFALHEMKVVLATLFSRVRLELAAGEIRAKRRGAFLAPKGGPRVRVKT